MSDLLCKLEAESEVLKVPADSVYEFFKYRPYSLCHLPSSNIHSAELLQGEWANEGCLIQWNYSYDGKHRGENKELIEAIDDKNRSMSWTMIDGHLLEIYKSFKAVLQVIPSGDNRCAVRWIMEYEKPHDEVMDPHAKLQFAVEICKEIEAYLIQEQTQAVDQ